MKTCIEFSLYPSYNFSCFAIFWTLSTASGSSALSSSYSSVVRRPSFLAYLDLRSLALCSTEVLCSMRPTSNVLYIRTSQILHNIKLQYNSLIWRMANLDRCMYAIFMQRSTKNMKTPANLIVSRIAYLSAWGCICWYSLSSSSSPSSIAISTRILNSYATLISGSPITTSSSYSS